MNLIAKLEQEEELLKILLEWRREKPNVDLRHFIKIQKKVVSNLKKEIKKNGRKD